MLMTQIRIRNTAHFNVWCYLGADPPTGRHSAAALLRADHSRLHPARNHMRLYNWGFRTRIHLILIRIQHFLLKTRSGSMVFLTKNLTKFTAGKKLIFFYHEL
jgi:hypothetical protein